MIANILEKSPRTLRRYQHEMGIEQSNFENSDCFKMIFASISRRFQARSAYFINLANKPGTQPKEKLEAMKAAHKIDMDMVDVFAKLKSKYTKD